MYAAGAYAWVALLILGLPLVLADTYLPPDPVEAAKAPSTQIPGNGSRAPALPDFGRKLIVCTSSIHNFGISCEGSFNNSLVEDPAHKCPPYNPKNASDDGKFCGYDVDMWRCVFCFQDMTMTTAFDSMVEGHA
jgi:hypothetical protein